MSAATTFRRPPVTDEMFRWDLRTLFGTDAAWAAAAAAWLASGNDRDAGDGRAAGDALRRAEELLMYAECVSDLGRATDVDAFRLAPAVTSGRDRLLALLAGPDPATPAGPAASAADAIAARAYAVHAGLDGAVSRERRASATAGHLDLAVLAHRARALAEGHTDAVAAAEVRSGLEPGRFDRLVSTVRAHLPLLRRYLAARRRLLLDDPGPDPRFRSPATGYAAVRQALEPWGDGYGDRMDRVVAERRVHVRPAQPDGGQVAHTAHAIGVPSRVLLDWRGTRRDVSALAHELGHAVHGDACSDLPPGREADRIVREALAMLAELQLAEAAADDDVPAAVTLGDLLAKLVFRQTLFVELELWMHRTVAAGATLTSAALSARTAELSEDYYGPGPAERADDWLRVRHLFWNFEIPVYPLAADLALRLHRRPGWTATALLPAMAAGAATTSESLRAAVPAGDEDLMTALEEVARALERAAPGPGPT